MLSQREGLQPVKDDNIDLVNSLNCQGVESYKKGDYNDAVKNFKLALEMYKRLFPGDHQDVADSYNNLGLAYDEMKDYIDSPLVTVVFSCN